MSGIERQLALPDLLKRKSFFLLGPRSTGKSFLIRHQLGNQAFVVDLLRSDLYLQLSGNPVSLEAMIAAADSPGMRYVVIDEIQKIPGLLDEVHRLIESRGWRFLLTGSSARKLRRGHANLLAGRAWTAHLFPLTWRELGGQFNLERYLRYGGLPQVYLGTDPDEELHAYVKTYLYEEIQAESAVRKIPQFSRFLRSAALSNGLLLNFAQIASDTAVPASTIREHYAILDDTLVGFMLPAWTGSKSRKAITTAKFFFFDPGVTHALAGTRTIDRNSDLYSRSFEQFIIMEVRACMSYQRRRDELYFWQSTHQHEVDLICGDHTAIEIKATKKITSRDLRGLKALAEEKKFKNYCLVSQDPVATQQGEILCVPWERFLDQLWGGGFTG